MRLNKELIDVQEAVWMFELAQQCAFFFCVFPFLRWFLLPFPNGHLTYTTDGDSCHTRQDKQQCMLYWILEHWRKACDCHTYWLAGCQHMHHLHRIHILLLSADSELLLLFDYAAAMLYLHIFTYMGENSPSTDSRCTNYIKTSFPCTLSDSVLCALVEGECAQHVKWFVWNDTCRCRSFWLWKSWNACYAP